MARKINWPRISAKYHRLAEEVRHDADRALLAGLHPVRSDLLDLSGRLAEMAATFAPVGKRNSQ